MKKSSEKCLMCGKDENDDLHGISLSERVELRKNKRGKYCSARCYYDYRKKIIEEHFLAM
ncbi:hypothetical protein LCGC14_1099360 [marine sediment metagenome]|uniref:MYM-type domain-containing protein n=1 Tax=marine sediment metagenome TaxID=412755 RepID=A0A0F9MA01_9ZZZZ